MFIIVTPFNFIIKVCITLLIVVMITRVHLIISDLVFTSVHIRIHTIVIVYSEETSEMAKNRRYLENGSIETIS